MGFRLVKAEYYGQSIPLSIVPEKAGDNIDNYFTVLIGKNGVGKSRFIADVCRAFDYLDNNNVAKRRLNNNQIDQLVLEYTSCNKNIQLKFIGGKLVEPSYEKNCFKSKKYYHSPRKVIASTITPFDKFDIGKRKFDETECDDIEQSHTYRYIGSKNYNGLSSSTGQLTRVIESIMFATKRGRHETARLSDIFRFLGYEPKITVNYSRAIGANTYKKLSDAFISINDNIANNSHKCSTDNKIWLNDIINPYITSSIFNIDYKKESEGVFNKYFTNLIQNNRVDRKQDKSNDLSDIWLNCSNVKYNINKLSNAFYNIGNNTSEYSTFTIELDFDSDELVSSSFKLFKHALSLKRLGLLSFSDLYLEKISSGNKVKINDASSGEQSILLTFLGIASEIEDNSLIVIDEPEISLHPEWQENYLELLKMTFSGYHGCHFLLATHSPLLLTKTGDDCVVVSMDDLMITNAKKISRRSMDYQLAITFGTPGYRNEYLAREGLAALRLASHRKFDSVEFKEKIALLRRLRPQLQDDDPVAQMTDALVQAIEEVSK